MSKGRLQRRKSAPQLGSQAQVPTDQVQTGVGIAHEVKPGGASPHPQIHGELRLLRSPRKPKPARESTVGPQRLGQRRVGLPELGSQRQVSTGQIQPGISGTGQPQASTRCLELQVIHLNLRVGRLRPRQTQLRIDLQRTLEIHPLGKVQLACQSPARGGPWTIQPHVEVIVAPLPPRPQTQIQRALQNHIPDGIQRPIPGADATPRDGHGAIPASQGQLGCGERVRERGGAHLQPPQPHIAAAGRTSITPLEAQIAIQKPLDAEIVAAGHQSRQPVQHQSVHAAAQIQPGTIPVAAPFKLKASRLIAPAQS